MCVIAKMTVRSVEDYGTSRKVSFSCIHDADLNKGDDTSEKDKSFTHATPSGEAWMTIDNRFVWDAFQPVKDYTQEGYVKAQHYVVFIPAEQYELKDVYDALDYIASKKSSAE